MHMCIKIQSNVCNKRIHDRSSVHVPHDIVQYKCVRRWKTYCFSFLR